MEGFINELLFSYVTELFQDIGIQNFYSQCAFVLFFQQLQLKTMTFKYKNVLSGGGAIKTLKCAFKQFEKLFPFVFMLLSVIYNKNGKLPHLLLGTAMKMNWYRATGHYSIL